MSHGLPNPPQPEPVAHTDLDCLAPKFRAAVLELMDRVEDETGVRPKVSESYRSYDRQDWLYGFGRTWDDGRGVVTHRDSSNPSWHEGALAVDLIHPVKEWSDASYFDAIGRAADVVGLKWGGHWQGGECDRPHVEWGLCKDSPSDHGCDLIDDANATGDFTKLWTEVGAA